MRPRERGTLLALVEIYQLQERPADALQRLEQLLAIDASDPVVLLSFAELVLDDSDPEQLRRVVELSVSIDNETPIHTALLLYRARALAGLKLPQAAIEVLTVALRRRKNRPDELLRQLRYGAGYRPRQASPPRTTDYSSRSHGFGLPIHSNRKGALMTNAELSVAIRRLPPHSSQAIKNMAAVFQKERIKWS